MVSYKQRNESVNQYLECIAVRHDREKHHVTSLAPERAPISHSNKWVIQFS